MAGLFDAARLVPAEEVARTHGIHFLGKRAFCPFHDDGEHPALSFRNGRFRCFACGETGDSIDLVQLLLGIGNMEAAEHINRHFGLGLTYSPEDDAMRLERRRAAQEKQRRRQAVIDAHGALCWAWRYLRDQDPSCWEDLKPPYLALLKYRAEINMLLDALGSLSDADQYELIIEYQKVVDMIAGIQVVTNGAHKSMLEYHQRGL